MSLIRVVSYNIHKGRSALGRRDSLNELRLGLYGLRPDLVFLQEVQGRNENKSLLDAQHESLAAALRLDVAYGRNAIRHQTDHGNALLSRFPIVEHENQDISDHRLEQRGLLHARIELDGRAVHCFVVHLGLFAGSRSRQILALTERIRRLVPEGDPILIAGDFNDWGDRLAPLFVQQLGLYEVFSHAPRSHGGELPRLRDSVKRLTNALRGVPNGISVMERTNQLGMDGSSRLLLPPPRTFPPCSPGSGWTASTSAASPCAARACCAAGNGPGCPIIPRCWPSWNCREARAGQAGLDGRQRHPAVAEWRGLLPVPVRRHRCRHGQRAPGNLYLHVGPQRRDGAAVPGRSRCAASRCEWCWTVSAAPPPPTRSASGSPTPAPSAASSGPSRAGSPS